MFWMCGFCNERVTDINNHSCDIIKSLKQKMDAALCGIQSEMNHRLNRAMDIEVFHTFRQTVEAWQRGCEVLIDTLNRRVRECEDKCELPEPSYIKLRTQNGELRNKIDILVDCLDRKQRRIDELEAEKEGRINNHACDAKHYMGNCT